MAQKHKIHFTPLARQDLDLIWQYSVATWSQQHAQAYLLDIDATCQLLAKHPDLARPRHEFAPPVRLYPCRSHLIIYISHKTHIEIIRIVHMRQNWRDLIFDR